MGHNCTCAHIHRFTLQTVMDVVQPLLLIQRRYKQTRILLSEMRLIETVTTGIFFPRRNDLTKINAKFVEGYEFLQHV